MNVVSPQAALARAVRSAPTADESASDAVLITRIAGEDKLAMRALFARHYVRTYRFILRWVRDASIAEDLISEVFLDVWRQAQRFEARSSVSTWILAIARNKAITAARRRKEEALDERTAAAIEDPADDPEVAMAKKDRGDVVRKCLTLLPAPHREVIDLVYYHGKSIDEVAALTKVPANTVKTRMFYARKTLGALLRAAGIESASVSM